MKKYKIIKLLNQKFDLTLLKNGLKCEQKMFSQFYMYIMKIKK